jgi:uncharacterized membrane protein YdbT with pleckstrin-like domain
MPFPTRLLNEGEQVVLDLRPHWWFLSGPLLWLLVAAAAAVAATSLEAPAWAVLALLALTGLVLLWLVGRYLRWTTTNFVVTTDRLVYRSGVVAKRGMEIPLERVNNIAFHQTVLARLLRSGDLLIESAGESGQQKFTDIARPSRVQNEIYRQMELAAGRDADRRAGRRELSIPEQIEKLHELRQRGIISQAEFESKKTQLLDRL